jgi:hypothetical protein
VLKKALLTIPIFAIVGAVGAFTLPEHTAKAVDSPLITEVQHQQEQLNNHEARITNVENDVNGLHDATGAPKPVSNITVTEVSTPEVPVEQFSSATPTVEDTTVRVTEGVMRVEADGNYFCDLTYSDGSTESIHQGQVFSFMGKPVVPGNCDKYIGQAKA